MKFLQRKGKLRWWTSHQLERRRSVWRHREVSCHRRRRCSFQKTSRSRRRSGSSPWPARSTNTRSSFLKAQEYFDLNNLQPVVLLHQLHGPWPRDLHTFKSQRNHQRPGLWGPFTTCVSMLGAAGSPGKIGSELVLFTPGRADKARLQTLTIGWGWGWCWWWRISINMDGSCRIDHYHICMTTD